MIQLTKEQALEIAKSNKWKQWTTKELFNLQIRQDRLFCDFNEFHKATEKVLGRPVFTHEFGLNREGLIKESNGGKQPTLKEIIELIPQEKLLIALV